MTQIEIDAKVPLCTIYLEAPDGWQVDIVHSTFVPAVGDLVEVAKQEQAADSWSRPRTTRTTYSVDRRVWDLNDPDEPTVTLTVAELGHQPDRH